KLPAATTALETAAAEVTVGLLATQHNRCWKHPKKKRRSRVVEVQIVELHVLHRNCSDLIRYGVVLHFPGQSLMPSDHD
ncbi:hypothetical protein CHARACLAT_013527, partial [Characodon lateralis]|nr:hypothetical protein [Characodon lateralis]